MERIIEFDRWVDPFKEAVNAFSSNDKDDMGSGDDFDNYSFSPKRPSKKLFSGPALVGPMGIVPLTEENISSDNFDLWVGHTNFDLGRSECIAIEKTEGVELLKIYSRYRFLIGVGKTFEAGRVFNEIKSKLCYVPLSLPEEYLPTGVELVHDVLNTAFSFWAVALLKDERIDIAGGENKEELKDKLIEWERANLEVFTSWGSDG